MRMYDIIEKKRDGRALTDDEIAFFISGFVSGEIPDYQASALLMAIYLRGMDARETLSLTMHMLHSGDVVDLSGLGGITVDKHSTGGVGDKTSLAVVPLLAAMDPGSVYVAKMSGRGLGHTGGTLDKLESIPGLTTEIGREDFLDIVQKHGGAIISQTGNLVPADKLLYALRDVTATVGSIPLIASSIMSKKLASGSDCILLDVKVGSGAFMKTVPQAIELAQTMVAIGQGAGRRVKALVTNMDRPLGRAIGNSLEAIEVARTLNGRGPADLEHECLMITGELMELTGRMDAASAREKARLLIQNGEALEKLCEIVQAQGGDPEYLRDTALFEPSPIQHRVLAPCDGFICRIDTERVGIASAQLGAGRLVKGDAIDYAAGIELLANYGDPVRKGQTVAILHTSSESLLAQAVSTFNEALTFDTDRPRRQPLLFATVDADGVAYPNDALPDDILPDATLLDGGDACTDTLCASAVRPS